MIMTTDPRLGPDWKRFGQWIARKMDALDITDRELARRTGLSATHVGKLRAGETGTKDETITKIALALHATPEEAKRAMIRVAGTLTPEQAEMPRPPKQKPVSPVKKQGVGARELEARRLREEANLTK